PRQQERRAKNQQILVLGHHRQAKHEPNSDQPPPALSAPARKPKGHASQQKEHAWHFAQYLPAILYKADTWRQNHKCRRNKREPVSAKHPRQIGKDSDRRQ